MLPIVTPAEMREIDASASEPIDLLIHRAGWHVARVARSMLGGVYGRRVVVIAGPGNNGADGRVAAHVLSGWGVRVDVVTPSASSVGRCDLVIDAAFGTGANRPYQSPSIPDGTPVLAVDIPSGVSGDTGQVLGSPLTAERTVTFAALKPGLVLEPAASLAGQVDLIDIGLDASGARAWLYTERDARQQLPRRSPTDHKWKRAVWVIGGSSGMYGAPLLASSAVLRSGGGMAWCGLPGQSAPAIASEVVFRPLPGIAWHELVMDDGQRFGALVIGCGLGRSDEAKSSVRALVEQSDKPMVIDGDGLHALHGLPLRPDIVLTPHDGEFEALTGSRPGTDRFVAARDAAAATGATVLLKGPLTIVASPEGTCVACDRGDDRLATAGTGDVLAGAVGSLLAAGMEPQRAAALGAWLHGEAGRRGRRVGMVASDLLDGLAAVAADLSVQSPPVTTGDAHAPH